MPPDHSPVPGSRTRRDASAGPTPPAALPGRPALRLVDAERPRPAAAGTEPLLVPSSTFETRRLVATGPARLELRRTAQERALTVVFAVLGAGVAAIGAERLGDVPFGPGVWLPPLAGLAMIAFAVHLHRGDGQVVIDGRACELRRTGGPLFARDARAARVPFADVAAVQCLACRFADEEASWTVHQINLVRTDGSRVHVCSHVDASIARTSAERVARAIGVGVLREG